MNDGLDPEVEALKEVQIQDTIPSLREFYPEFRQRREIELSESTCIFYDYCFKAVCDCPELADTPLSEIRKRNALDYLHARIRQDNVSQSTAKHEIKFVQNVLARAVEWDYLHHNPLQRLRLPSDPPKLDVRISSEQIADLIEAMPTQGLQDIVEFAIYSGFRKTNILTLRIENVEVFDINSGEQQRGQATILPKARKQPERFPLGPSAIDVFRRSKGTRMEGWVFLKPNTQARYRCIHSTFDRAVYKLGLTSDGKRKLRFHDLRHIHATWLEQAGVPLPTIQLLMGHKDSRTTDRYITRDRLAAGNALELLPRIELSRNEKCPVEKLNEASSQG